MIANATHHQRGARPSTTPEIRSVIQPKFRLFKTAAAPRLLERADASPDHSLAVENAMVLLHNSDFQFPMKVTARPTKRGGGGGWGGGGGGNGNWQLAIPSRFSSDSTVPCGVTPMHEARLATAFASPPTWTHFPHLAVRMGLRCERDSSARFYPQRSSSDNFGPSVSFSNALSRSLRSPIQSLPSAASRTRS